MAIVASGDPLELRHGVALYSAQTTLGTPVTPATTVGAALVGVDKQSNNREFRGPGSANRYAVKGGMTICPWQIRWDGLQSGVKTLLLKAQRVDGVCPMLTLGFGYQDDTTPTPAKSADQIPDCKVGSLELTYTAGNDHNPISGTMSGLGRVPTTLTSLAPATSTTTPWYTYEAVVTRGGTAFPLVDYSVTLNHNLTPKTRLPGATPASQKRSPFYISEGDEMISGSLRAYNPTGVAVQADSISTAAMVVVLTNLVDAVTLTLTYTGVDFTNENQEHTADGLFWSCNWGATTLVIS